MVDGLSAFAQIANHNSYKNSYQYLAGNAISQTRQTYEGWSQTNRLSFQAHVDYNKSFATTISAPWPDTTSSSARSTACR